MSASIRRDALINQSSYTGVGAKISAVPAAPAQGVLAEGQSLTITTSAGGAGTYQRYDSNGVAQRGAVPLAPGVAVVGPFSGTQKILITPTAGSIDATVGDAVLGAALLTRDVYSNEIGLAGPAVNAQVEEAFRLAFSQVMPKTTPTIVETVPAVLAGNRYYFDPIGGNDALAGNTPATAWASLTKLNGLNPGAGAKIFIADDAVFDYADTLAAYRARTRFTYNGADNMRGTAALPILIRPYSARPNYGPIKKEPTIRWYASLVAGDWTNETGIGANIWSVPWNPAGFDNDNEAWVCFGPDKVLGVAPRQQVVGQAFGNTPQQLAKNFDYAFSAGKLYVWSTGNPTTAFNGVFLCGLPVFSTYWEGLHHVKFIGLRFEFCRAFNLAYSSTTLNGVQGFEVQGCKLHRAIFGYFGCSATNASASEMGVSFRDNILTETPFAAIHFAPTTGTAGNSISWEVYRNKVYGGNYCSAGGGALLYNQCAGGTKHIAWGNYGFDCRNGTGGVNIDGAMLYSDVSTKKSIFYGNIAEQCAVPFQMNNSIESILLSNLAIDCNILVQITGAADVNVPNQSYIAAQNTWLWTGRIADTALQKGPGAPSLANGAVILQWNDNFGAFGNKFASLAIFNNLAISLSPGTAANKPMLNYSANTVTTFSVAGNAAMGLGPQLARDVAAATDTTYIAGIFCAIASAADAALWMKGAAAGNARIAPDSPIIGLGAAISVQYQDILGKNFGARPTPGCYEPLA